VAVDMRIKDPIKRERDAQIREWAKNNGTSVSVARAYWEDQEEAEKEVEESKVSVKKVKAVAEKESKVLSMTAKLTSKAGWKVGKPQIIYVFEKGETVFEAVSTNKRLDETTEAGKTYEISYMQSSGRIFDEKGASVQVDLKNVKVIKEV